ncbi:hypothetical protein [Curtobacterium sp. 20TX0008]|uniref:hypothetical protein n=1 Tax=Curtobacterium sp. 20TX0008 TaxID=3022018 RepID=UPI00232E1FB0|nr:hypothetical protein [Curtobacterium sp. 20TX0008]MDB6427466.1 hypothetical protein [Curtobacterium sp. 20TX0008]
MSADWAPTWSYQWLADIGVPAIVGSLAAVGTLAVGIGAVAVAVSSNRIASRIANREHDADSLQSRVTFGTAVMRWSDQLIEEIRDPVGRISVDGGVVVGRKAQSAAGSADEQKAEVDAAAAAFHADNGRDLVAFVELLTTKAPHENKPSDYRVRDELVAIRRAHVQAWIANPAMWKTVDNSARLTATEWTRAAQIRGEFEDKDQALVHPGTDAPTGAA